MRSLIFVCLVDFIYVLHLPNYSFFVSIIFSAKIFIFNQKPDVINKINTKYSRNYNSYYSQYNIHLKTIFYSFIDYFILLSVILTNFVLSSSYSTHSSTIKSINFFYTYNLNNLSIDLYYTIYHTHTYSYLD